MTNMSLFVKLHIVDRKSSLLRGRFLIYLHFEMGDEKPQLPLERRAWILRLQQTYQQLDKKLVNIVCFNNQILEITMQLYDFLDRFLKVDPDKLITIEQARKMSAYVEAIRTFATYCKKLTAPRWLGFFLADKIHASIDVFSEVWDIWCSCANQFNYPSFEFKEALFYAYSQDILSIHAALTGIVPGVSFRYRSAIIRKMIEIEWLLNIISSDHNKVNSYILKQTQWQIVKENIGVGGYAIVHLAKMKSTGQLVAVKELKAVQLSKTRMLYLKREIDALMRLSHPNVIKLIGVTVTPPFCIVTTYAPNGVLIDLVSGKGDNSRATPLFRTKVALDIARAMEYVHSIGLIHRDLKPPNILLDENDRAVVCDFGLARITSSHMSGEVGTTQWVAPELMTQDTPYTTSVDVYAYGIMLWELLTDGIPYKGLKTNQICNLVLKYGERPEIPEDCPPRLAKVIKRTWAQRPEDRPSFYDLRRVFERGDCLYPGTNAEEFMAFVNATKAEHEEAMKEASQQKSVLDSAVSILHTKSPYDPLCSEALETLIYSKISLMPSLDKIVIMAGLKESSELAKRAIVRIVDDISTNASVIASSIEPLFKSDPEFVITQMRKLSVRIVDSLTVVQSYLKPDEPQTPHIIDVLGSFLTQDSLDYIFSLIDDKYAKIILAKYYGVFGVVKFLARVAFTNMETLYYTMRKLKENGELRFIDELKEDKLSRTTSTLPDGSWMNHQNFVLLADCVIPWMLECNPGQATAEIMLTCIKYEDTINILKSKQGYGQLARMFYGQRVAVAEAAVDVLKIIEVPKEHAVAIFEAAVNAYKRFNSIKILQCVLHLIKAHNGIFELSGFISAFLDKLDKEDHDKNQKYIKTLVKAPLRKHTLTFDDDLSKKLATWLGRLDHNCAALMGVVLHNIACKTVNSELCVASCLKFLYHKRPPFSIATPFLYCIIECIDKPGVIEKLISERFALYLYHIPVLYPNEPKVPEIIAMFANFFEAHQNS